MSRRSLHAALLASAAALSLVFAATASAGPVARTQGADSVTQTSAVLLGMAGTNNGPAGWSAVTYHFEYGTTTAYGTSTPDAISAPDRGGTYRGSASISGLTPDTTYHFKVVADGVSSEDGTFTTSMVHDASPPPGYGDSDNDHVVDIGDRCPTQPGAIAAFGCPDPDNDHLGGTDDQCPSQAGTVRSHGCPDADDDGWPDAQDKCPNESGSGTTSTDGCDDSDRDGVSRAADKCPTIYGPDRPDGCPLASFQATFAWGKTTDMQYLSVGNLTIGCVYQTKARGCSFHVTMRLTAASARALGVKDRTIFEVDGPATKRVSYGPGRGGFDRIAEDQIDIAPAMARALHKARRVTFELSGTYHWANERDQQLKTKDGKTVLRVTLTNKKSKNFGAGLFGKKATQKPQPPEEG